MENGLKLYCIHESVSGVTIVALLAEQQRRRQAETQLCDREERINLAATAAKPGMWVWDITHNQLWVTEQGRHFIFASRLGVTSYHADQPTSHRHRG